METVQSGTRKKARRTYVETAGTNLPSGPGPGEEKKKEKEREKDKERESCKSLEEMVAEVDGRVKERLREQ